jgi:4'-phosphopantetheinyl transferase
MLLDALKSEGVHYLLHELQHDFYRKPFLENWKPFNISHAGEMVVFCYGKHAVGVDLEKLDRLDDPGILRYFHPEEQEYIIASKSTDLAFYEIWVKKEALLKAIGIGITKGLDQFSCVQDKIRYAGTDWHLHKIDLQQQYLCYLCHQAPSIEVVTAEFDSFPEN